MTLALAPPIRQLSRGTRVAILFTLGTAAVVTLWLTWWWGGDHATVVMDDVFQIVAPAFAAVGCGVAWRRARGRTRFAWLMLGLSAATWGMGSAAWFVYEVLLNTPVPYPSLADAGYLGAVPLAVVSLLSFYPKGEASPRHILDALLVAGALFEVSWVTIISALYDPTASLLQNALGIAYPLSDVILLTLALSLVGRARGRTRFAISLICAGTLINAIADSFFTYLTAQNAYGGAQPMDVLWVVGYYAIGLAGIMRPGQLESGSDRRISFAAAVLPYGLVAIGLAVGAVGELGGTSHAVSFWNGAGLLAVLLVRQALVLRDNLHLTGRLEQRVAERTREVAARERRFRSLVQRSTDSTSVIDANGLITYQSPAVEQLLGYQPEQVLGWPLASLVDAREVDRLTPLLADLARRPKATSALELRMLHRDGPLRVCEATLTNMLDDEDVRGVVVNMRDITDRRRLQDQLTHDALHDRLTQLPNRALFNERLRHALEQSKRGGLLTTVLFIDLDRLKAVNDSLGHGAGDSVLTATAGRLLECVRASDTVARLGGDEFGIVLEGAPLERASEVAYRVLEAMRRPIATSAGEQVITASIGVATAASDEMDPDDIVRDADVAMYLAKENGRDRMQVFDPSRHSRLIDEIRLQADLRGALAEGELRVFFQPVVRFPGADTVGLEALLRWQHPVRGIVEPDVFIPIAERSGLIVSIGRWVLAEACRLALAWFEESPQGTLEWISVNISAQQLVDDELLNDVTAALASSGLPGERLVLEITESGLMSAPARITELLQSIRRLGVRIALDDFGTGYSSLSYLESFPIDILKVDRSFLDGRDGDELSVLAKTIVDLSHNLNVPAIAEGVERRSQADSLIARHCEMGQGFLFARPMPAEDVATYLAEHDLAARGELGTNAPGAEVNERTA